MWARCVVAGLALALRVSGQERPVYRIGRDVLAPKVLKKVEPVYAPEARDARVEGTVLLSIVVSEEGRADEIKVVKPLGSGLDERAIAAVQQWVFQPGTKDEKPVRVFATVEVNFRLTARPEQPRGETARPAEPPQTVDLGALMERVKHKDPAAMFELGSRQLMAQRDEESAWKLIHGAAELGNTHAQQFLGDRYSTGMGVDEDHERSRHYYSLCARGGLAMCQHRLAESLFSKDGATRTDKLKVFAWALIARAKGLEPSAEIATAIQELSPDEREGVSRMQQKLEPK